MYQSVTKLRKVDFVCVGCITPPVCLLWLHVSQLSLSFRSTHYIRHQTSDIREQTLCVCLTLKKNSSKFSFVLRWRHKKNRKTTWLTELRRLKVWLIKLNLFFFILSSPGFPHIVLRTKQQRRRELTARFLHELLAVGDVVDAGAAGAHPARPALTFYSPCDGRLAAAGRLYLSVCSPTADMTDMLLSQSWLSWQALTDQWASPRFKIHCKSIIFWKKHKHINSTGNILHK